MQVYMFRPGYIHPAKGSKNTHGFYHVIGFLYPVMRSLLPAFYISMKELGQAMINSVNKGYEKPLLECKDIAKLAQK